MLPASEGGSALIREFAHNTSNMLEYLVDKLQPRDFERQARESFQEVLNQIGIVTRPRTPPAEPSD